MDSEELELLVATDWAICSILDNSWRSFEMESGSRQDWEEGLSRELAVINKFQKLLNRKVGYFRVWSEDFDEGLE